MSTYHHDLNVQMTTIRFCSSSSDGDAISDQDTCIALLKGSIYSMDLQVDDLRTKVNEYTMKAKNAVSRQARSSALAALHSKKLLQKSLSETHASKSKVEEVLFSIIQAKENVTVLELMERANNVLKQLSTATGSSDRVHNLMETIRENQSEVVQIGNTLSQSSLDSEIEQGALEEFEELLGQEQVKEDVAKQESIAKLPNVEDNLLSPPEERIRPHSKESKANLSIASE